mmetsp:Transcript_15447/g.41917  ORF Transcript_15447/g.41917 Transcript_15447/m.41917 type:complete len:117 (+) Transcript_15447:327-677(+)
MTVYYKDTDFFSITKNILELIVKKIVPRVNKKETLRSVNPDLTAFYFTNMFIRSKNSGKSYGLVKMIKSYGEHPITFYKGNRLEIRTILDFPTGNSDANPYILRWCETKYSKRNQI